MHRIARGAHKHATRRTPGPRGARERSIADALLTWHDPRMAMPEARGAAARAPLKAVEVRVIYLRINVPRPQHTCRLPPT